MAMRPDRTGNRARAASARRSVVRRGLVAVVALTIAGWAPAGAQPGFEETDFAGWTTTATALPGRTVSGVAETSGGAPGGHYRVRHEHELFETFPNTVASFSFAPELLDPSSIGLDHTVRFSADFRFDFELSIAPYFAPYFVWVPVVEQAGRVYRSGATGPLEVPGSFLRSAAEVGPDLWRAGVSDPPLQVGAGAPPVRIGLLIQSDLPVAIERNGAAIIRIDNLSVIPEVPGPPGTADLAVELCGTAFQSLVGDGTYTAMVTNHGPETAIGVVLHELPRSVSCLAGCQVDSLAPGASTSFEIRPNYLDVVALPSWVVSVHVASDLPDANPSNDVASQSTTRLNCDEIGPGCPVLAALAEDICEQRLPRSSCAASSGVRPALGARAGLALGRAAGALGRRLLGAAVGIDLDVLYRLREEVMRPTPAGRRAIELYETHGPEISGLVLRNPSLRERSLQALSLWMENLRSLVEGHGGSRAISAEQIAAIEAVLDELGGLASPELLAVLERERERIDLPAFVGSTMAQAFARARQLGCDGAETALCLGGGRFRATVSWRDFRGNTGVGRAAPLTEDTGTFWFFDPGNVELVVKVLDGRGLNERFWVFYGALSSVEYTLEIEDTATGAIRSYQNPLGNLASVADVAAFAGPGDVSSIAPAPPPAASSCAPDGTRLCLGGGRFEVEVEWRDFAGESGVGNAVDLTSDSGTFWFFDPENVELVVKVLDGRLLNGRFWVFYGALSNVAYTLTVRDRDTGRVRTYANPTGHFASFADTDAF